MNDLLIVRDVTRAFRMGGVTLQVLKGISLAVREREILTIVGPSGAGKSTLLHLMGFLDRPTTGDVQFDGRRLTQMSDSERDRVRNRAFGFVFQMHHLLPDLTALENVLLPLQVRWGGPAWWAHGRDARARARTWLERLGLGARLGHRPAQLSGGERQRVAIARALVGAPAVLLCDEPTGNLDSETSREILSILRGLNEQDGLTIVIVTHDDGVAALGRRRIRIVDGRICP
jgi:ABC-type lipoprotein export system ATPase subunit